MADVFRGGGGYRENIVLFLLSTLVLSWSADARSVNSTSKFSPVILIPGDGGSQIEAKLDKPSTVHIFCDKTTVDFFNIWLNLELLIPYIIDCFVDNVRLDYNNVTRSTSNSPGVQVRTPGFGNTSSVEWLDPSHASQGLYFSSIVEAMVALGYERGVTVKGAPYDFRKAANGYTDFFSALIGLIEDTYSEMGNTKVTLITHSMGGVMALYMLNHQSQAWKDKYIESLVTLASPWGGSVKSLLTLISGYNLDSHALNPFTLRTAQRTWPSTAWLMPVSSFWDPRVPIVKTGDRHYGVKDYKQLLLDIGCPDCYEMYLDTKNLTSQLVAPNVPVYCIHGLAVKTPEFLTYGTGFPNVTPDIVFGDGDGTVGSTSLAGCMRWETQSNKVIHLTVKGASHIGMLADPDIIAYIEQILMKKI